MVNQQAACPAVRFIAHAICYCRSWNYAACNWGQRGCCRLMLTNQRKTHKRLSWGYNMCDVRQGLFQSKAMFNPTSGHLYRSCKCGICARGKARFCVILSSHQEYSYFINQKRSISGIFLALYPCTSVPWSKMFHLWQIFDPVTVYLCKYLDQFSH